jgi:hypothetical protein
MLPQDVVYGLGAYDVIAAGPPERGVLHYSAKWPSEEVIEDLAKSEAPLRTGLVLGREEVSKGTANYDLCLPP